MLLKQQLQLDFKHFHKQQQNEQQEEQQQLMHSKWTSACLTGAASQARSGSCLTPSSNAGSGWQSILALSAHSQ
jgi:hypothetical protein